MTTEGRPNQEETEKLARLIALQLQEQHQKVKGVIIKGTRAAGVAFVIGYAGTSTFDLTWGSETDDQIRRRVAEQITNGGLPVGFVRVQSRKVERGYKVWTESQLFPPAEHLGPWATEILELAVQSARSQWSPKQ